MKKILKQIQKIVESIPQLELEKNPRVYNAYTIGAQMVAYRGCQIPILKVCLDKDDPIDDDVIMLNPLPSYQFLFNKGIKIFMEILAYSYFSNRFIESDINRKLYKLYLDHMFVFPKRKDFINFSMWILGSIKPFLTGEKTDIKKYAELLLEKGSLSYEEDLSEDYFTSPVEYCL